MTTADTTRAVRLVAVNAGLGEPSSTRMLIDRITDSVAETFAGEGVSTEVRVIDLRDLAIDIASSLTSGFADATVRDALEAIYAADGLVVATPVFNASYSGLFKSFFDLVDVDRMAGKPVLIGATGGSPRHSMVLDHAIRPLFGFLRAVVVPTGIYAAAEDWAGTSGDTTALSDRIRRAAGELAAQMRPTGTGGSPATPVVDPRTSVEAAGIANFARLLGGR